MENAGRNQAQHRLAAGDDERVAGIVAALEPHDALRVLGQPVDDLAFPLVAPLGSDDDDVLAHGWMFGEGEGWRAANGTTLTPIALRCRRVGADRE